MFASKGKDRVRKVRRDMKKSTLWILLGIITMLIVGVIVVLIVAGHGTVKELSGKYEYKDFNGKISSYIYFDSEDECVMFYYVDGKTARDNAKYIIEKNKEQYVIRTETLESNSKRSFIYDAKADTLYDGELNATYTKTETSS